MNYKSSNEKKRNTIFINVINDEQVFIFKKYNIVNVKTYLIYQ